jgi:FemAB-related protein (PEP-CTERM system-associated)
MTLRVSGMNANTLEWDTFVRAQKGWTAFHLAAWKSLIERVFDHECLYLEARDEAGALHGVLPLVRVRSLLFGHYLVSMPFVNYGGPLGSAPAVRALVDHAVVLAADSGVRLLELRSRTALPVDLPVSHRKITVVLDLPADVEGLRKALGAKLRSQIKRPEKEGVTVRFGADQVDPFFEVFARHMRDLGTPTQPRRLFREIAASFGDDAWFGCAWLGSRPVACGAGFRWGNEFEITWASSLREYNRVAPNMLLYWAFLERAVQQGLTLFNFGRCTPGEGTHHFKKQWGSRDEQLWWYQAARDAGTGTPSPDDSAYSWGPRLWKRLPLSVATALGPRLVRGIP